MNLSHCGLSNRQLVQRFCNTLHTVNNRLSLLICEIQPAILPESRSPLLRSSRNSSSLEFITTSKVLNDKNHTYLLPQRQPPTAFLDVGVADKLAASPGVCNQGMPSRCPRTDTPASRRFHTASIAEDAPQIGEATRPSHQPASVQPPGTGSPPLDELQLQIDITHKQKQTRTTSSP